MRSILAAISDAGAVAVVAFGGFRFAFWATPCGSNQGDCFPLAPSIVLSVILATSAYFGIGYLVWRTSPGQRMFGL